MVFYRLIGIVIADRIVRHYNGLKYLHQLTFPCVIVRPSKSSHMLLQFIDRLHSNDVRSKQWVAAYIITFFWCVITTMAIVRSGPFLWWSRILRRFFNRAFDTTQFIPEMVVPDHGRWPAVHLYNSPGIPYAGNREKIHLAYEKARGGVEINVNCMGQIYLEGEIW